MIRRARRRSWRRWLWGPKHGIARGIAVYGTPGADSFAASLGACAELRAWAANRGVVLNDQPDDLVVLDHVLDEIRAAPATEARVATDIGLYLGTVIVSTIPGASWQAWPNGHPVVAVPHGKPIDVVAMADRVYATVASPWLISTPTQRAAADTLRSGIRFRSRLQR